MNLGPATARCLCLAHTIIRSLEVPQQTVTAQIMTSDVPTSNSATFDSLVESRKAWIQAVLRPWCQTASLKELKKADVEWFDIAGKADPKATLWTWVWERFPAIVHPDLPGVHETYEVVVMLNDGRAITGFPDNRATQKGMLVLVGTDSNGSLTSHGPFSMDHIVSVIRASETSKG